MQIKDLSRELDAEAQAAVQGGDAVNLAALVGNGSQVVGGPSLLNVNASPTTVAQNAVDNDSYTVVGISSKVENLTANMTGSIGGIFQAS